MTKFQSSLFRGRTGHIKPKRYLCALVGCALGLLPIAGLTQTDVFMSGWQPKSATMQCIDLSTPPVNGIPSVDPILNGCIDEGLQGRLTGQFAAIAGWLETGGLQSPDYLRPVVPNASIGQGQAAGSTLLLYVNQAVNSNPNYYAGYSPPCTNTGIRTKNVGGIITFASEPSRFSRPGMPAWVLAHEVVHASQFSSGFARSDTRFCRGTRHTPFLNWIREGSADALALEYVRTKLPGQWNVLINPASKLWKRAAGLRRYDFPLQFREANNSALDSYLSYKHQYAVSSFWRHLAWRYHGGNIFYLRKFLDQEIDAPIDWTQWANDILKKDKATKHGFYTTYPTFIADWASMNTTQYFESAKVSDIAWRRRMFSCPTIEVAKGTKVLKKVKLKQLAAQCFVVKINDLNDGEIGTVRIFGRTTGATPLKELHLSEIERVSADNIRCSEILDGILDLGDKIVAGGDCVVHRTLPTNFAGWAEFAPAPVYGSGGEDKVIFAASRVKVNPGDADVQANQQAKEFEFEISVDYSIASIGSAGPKPAQVAFYDSRVWSNSSLPIDISHQTLAAQEGRLQGPAAGLAAMQVPITLETFTAINPTGQGAWSISLETYDVTTNQSPFGTSHSYEPKDTLTFNLKEGTELTAGQSYEAFVTYRQKPGGAGGIGDLVGGLSGSGGAGAGGSAQSLFGAIAGALTKTLSGFGSSPPRGRRDFEPTILTVTERSDDRITVEFNGRLCMGGAVLGGSRGRSAANCLSIEPLSGTFSIAYPDLYTVDGLLRYDQASEGNRIYRDRVAATYNRTIARAFGSGSPGTGSTGESGDEQPEAETDTQSGSAETPSLNPLAGPCDCSCEALEKLRGLSGKPNPLASGLNMGCIFQCAKEFAACDRQ